MHLEESIDIAAPREAVWKLISQTDRLNREIGLPPVQFTFQARRTAGTDALATLRVAGVTLHYREHPFQWQRPAFYSVRRTFQDGPINEINFGTSLNRVESGTRVTAWADVTPSSRLASPLCTALGRKALRDVISACKGFGAYLVRGAATPYPRQSSKPPADKARLEGALERLVAAGGDRALARLLADHVKQSPPDMALSIRPFTLADTWGAERTLALETCLHAAKTGMLDMHWRVLCPHCRGGRPVRGGLAGITEEAYCETCNIRFDAEFDSNVEVVFSVNQAIRPVQARTYCIGGPGLVAHAAVQYALPAHGRLETELDVAPADYRLTSLHAAGPIDIRILDSGASFTNVKLAVVDGAPVFTASESNVSRRATWLFENDCDEETVIRLEAPRRNEDSATAAEVTSLQIFRDQFGSEVLSPGAELAVRRICILFSDLKGSTAMYTRQGDARSYRDVREHFRWMHAILAEHRGGIVKTMGDAVMASFHDPADGLAAALAMQRRALSDPAGVVVKLGLHWGPALVVNTDGVLDYFGQTVNMAARVQQESQGKDIVLSALLREDPTVKRMLAASGCICVPFTATVRGIEQPVDLLRLDPGAALQQAP